MRICKRGDSRQPKFVRQIFLGDNLESFNSEIWPGYTPADDEDELFANPTRAAIEAQLGHRALRVAYTWEARGDVMYLELEYVDGVTGSIVAILTQEEAQVLTEFYDHVSAAAAAHLGMSEDKIGLSERSQFVYDMQNYFERAKSMATKYARAAAKDPESPIGIVARLANERPQQTIEDVMRWRVEYLTAMQALDMSPNPWRV